MVHVLGNIGAMPRFITSPPLLIAKKKGELLLVVLLPLTFFYKVTKKIISTYGKSDYPVRNKIST